MNNQEYTVPSQGLNLEQSLIFDGRMSCKPVVDFPVKAWEKLTQITQRTYPTLRSALEQKLAQRFDVEPENVFVAAGADQVLERCIQVFASQKALTRTHPTFEMIPRFAQTYQCMEHKIYWLENDFPLQEILETRNISSLFVVITPNNPTGRTVPLSTLKCLAKEIAPRLLIIDLAYGEFCSEDPTELFKDYPNTIVVRTLSKAWGLASARIGYALSSKENIAKLRCNHPPYPISSLSLLWACEALDQGNENLAANVKTIQEERQILENLFAKAKHYGIDMTPLPSQANFIALYGKDTEKIYQKLVKKNILTRFFPANANVPELLRVTCPQDSYILQMFCSAMEEIFYEQR